MVKPELKPSVPSGLHSAASGAAWITAEMVAVQGASLAFFVVTAHYVSPSDFGLMGMCYAILQFLKTIFIDNISLVVSRKSSATQLEYTTAFWLTVLVSVVCFMAIEAAAGLLNSLFDATDFPHVMREMGVVMLVMGLGRTHEAWMSRHFLFRGLAIRSSVGAVLGGASGLFLAVKGWGVTALVVQQVVTFLVALALLWANSPWRPGLAFSRHAAKEIMRYVLRTIPGNFVGVLNQTCDTLLVAHFFGAANAGYYSASKRLRLALQMVAVTPINGVAMPILADAQVDPPRFRQVLRVAFTVLCAACAPIFLGLSTVANDTILLVLGERWLPAAPLLAWLAFGGVMATLLSLNDIVFLIRGRVIWTFYVSGLYAILAVVGCVAVAGSGSGSGSLAIPFVLPFAVTLPLSMWLVLRLSGGHVGDLLRAFLPALAAAAVMVVAVHVLGVWLAGWGPVARLAILCPTGAAVYLGALGMLGGRETIKMAGPLLGRFAKRKRRGKAALNA